MTKVRTTAAQPSSQRSLSLVNAGAFLLVAAWGTMVYFTPLKSWLSQGEWIKDQLAQLGLSAPLIFTVGTASLVAIGVPRLLLCSLGGLIFGFVWALLLTQVGTVLGAYATFLFVRWCGRDYTLQRFPRLRGLSQRLEANGFMGVMLVRQLPVNGFYNDVFLGLSPVTHRDFLLGTFLGFLPLGVTACLVGAGLIQADIIKGIQYIALALLCSTVLGFLLKRIVNATTFA
jgi:uncharacterized membrane protein YdjX (TVP38/TMEM64 family)